MQARIKREGDVTIVDLMGRIEIETVEPFEKHCLDRLTSGRVVFNMKGVSFVGSNGIMPFLQSLRAFTEKNSVRPKFCSVSSEFQKIFEASSLRDIEIFEDESRAVEAYKRPTVTQVIQSQSQFPSTVDFASSVQEQSVPEVDPDNTTE